MSTPMRYNILLKDWSGYTTIQEDMDFEDATRSFFIHKQDGRPVILVLLNDFTEIRVA